jgi:hypothetical protein
MVRIDCRRHAREPALPHLHRLQFCGCSPPGRAKVIQRRWRAGERLTWATPSLNCSTATCACNVRQAHASSTPAGHHKPWLGSTGSLGDFARKEHPRTCTLERLLPRTAQQKRFAGKNAQGAHRVWEARFKRARNQVQHSPDKRHREASAQSAAAGQAGETASRWQVRIGGNN